MPAKHAFTSGIADGGDATLVRPSNWNAGHVGIAEANLAPAGNETITAGYSAVVVRSLLIASGMKLTIGSGARLRIL